MPESHRVLVVEDDYLIGMHITDTLAGAGFNAEFATTVDQARALIAQERFDTVVLDFRIGDQLSLGLADELREAKVPFIFCTGSVVGEVHEVFPGASVVAKPFREEELIDAISVLTAA